MPLMPDPPMPSRWKRNVQKDRSLNWKSCECGCHGRSAKVGSREYWMDENEMLSGRYVLHLGHGWLAPRMGTYTSFEVANQEILKDAKPELEVLRAQLREAERILG